MEVEPTAASSSQQLALALAAALLLKLVLAYLRASTYPYLLVDSVRVSGVLVIQRVGEQELVELLLAFKSSLDSSETTKASSVVD